MTDKIVTKEGTLITNPPIARLLFEDTRFSGVWLVVRVLLGLAWIDAASHKLGVPAWMETGTALQGFWTKAVQVDPATGKGPIAFEWYRNFIQGMLDSGAYVWFAKLVAIGELLIGVALILGAFVGIAAFLGAFMNWNFIMAGTASTNPLLFVAALLLVLAWKTAGWYGLDRFLLPLIGTPWNRRTVTTPETANERIQGTV
ncbi:MAG: DoxX family protein [Anaerolineae bacterium]|nr:DoxX family protein [Anaerolineae bacterium]